MKEYLSIGIVISLSLHLFTCTNLIDKQAEESQKLNQIFENYFEEFLRLFPLYATQIGDHRYDNQFSNDISKSHRSQQKDLFKKYLSRISEINQNILGTQDRLSCDIFKRELALKIKGLQFNDHLMPIHQYRSKPTVFAMFGSGTSYHPFKTVQDYDNFLERISGFQAWVDIAIANMREGIAKGITQPRILVEKALPQFEAHIVEDVKEGVFFNPITNIPSDFSKPDKTRLLHAYSAAIERKIIPTYIKLRDFIRDEYLPKCRATVGLSELPSGNEWYAYRTKSFTTTDMTPEDIFQTGIQEAERIRKEMEKIKTQVHFKGSLQDFFEYLRRDEGFYFNKKEDLLNGYEKLRVKTDAVLPRLFGMLPEANYDIRPIEEFREKFSTQAHYMSPAPDGSRPGIFYVNTYDLKSRPIYNMESLFLHEATPGHHLQISLQLEQKDLPKFRRFGTYVAYIEGWALYAESLGRELDLFTDPYRYFGKLTFEMLRSVRLVVDVGMHSKGWSREKALRFLMDNSSFSETEAVAQIERYIAWPGQALSYKIGQLKISEMRTKAEKMLGSQFDIRAFHDEILKHGALPLDVLETNIDEWILKQQ